MQVCTCLMAAAGLGIASAQELVDLVKDRVPGAAIDFQVDGNRQKIIDSQFRVSSPSSTTLAASANIASARSAG